MAETFLNMPKIEDLDADQMQIFLEGKKYKEEGDIAFTSGGDIKGGTQIDSTNHTECLLKYLCLLALKNYHKVCRTLHVSDFQISKCHIRHCYNGKDSLGVF